MQLGIEDEIQQREGTQQRDGTQQEDGTQPQPEEVVRWNIKVSKETDLSLRTFLGAQGMKKGDLSKFIEDAVRWRVFHLAVQDIKTRNAKNDPDELQRIVDEAVREVRTERRPRAKAVKA